MQPICTLAYVEYENISTLLIMRLERAYRGDVQGGLPRNGGEVKQSIKNIFLIVYINNYNKYFKIEIYIVYLVQLLKVFS